LGHVGAPVLPGVAAAPLAVSNGRTQPPDSIAKAPALVEQEVVAPHVGKEGRKALPVAAPECDGTLARVARQPAGRIPPEGGLDPAPEIIAVGLAHLAHRGERFTPHRAA